MSITNASRSLFLADPAPTLATVLAQVLEDVTLAKRHRQDVASALRTVGRALRRPLSDLPAHPGLLRDRLKGFVPSMAGLSASRWNNALSLTRKALDQAGLIQVPARSRLPLAPTWTALLRRPTEPCARIGLSRFARYCTTRAIDPEAVDDVVFTTFLEHLETASMSERPRAVHRMTIVIWNRMVQLYPEWPQRPIAVPDYRRGYAVPWSMFPASLQQDVAAYLDRLAGKDILAEHDARPLRPDSLVSLRCDLNNYLAALVHRGHDPQTFRTLADVVAMPVVKSGLRFLLDRARNKSTERAHHIAFRVTTLARHWVQVDAGHLSELQKLCKRLSVRRDGMTEKNRDRLRQFDVPENVRKLLMLPADLAAKVAGKDPAPAAALLMQMAVAVEILLMHPIRRSNLARLNLDRHFRRSSKGVVHLVIPPDEVKNSVGIDARLPAQTVRLIDLYVARYRPLLLTQPSPWLFPGVADRPKSREDLGVQISAAVKRHTELLVNPHLFRHVAAKLYLDAHPGAYGVIRLMHWHKSVNTTTRFYCGQETDAAIHLYDAHMLELGTRTPAGPAKPKTRQSTKPKARLQ